MIVSFNYGSETSMRMYRNGVGFGHRGSGRISLVMMMVAVVAVIDCVGLTACRHIAGSNIWDSRGCSNSDEDECDERLGEAHDQ